MIHRNADGDAAANLLERRWFASIAAVEALRSECAVLGEVMDIAESAWRREKSRLARLEAMRDALGEELAEFDGQRHVLTAGPVDCAVSSAA